MSTAPTIPSMARPFPLAAAVSHTQTCIHIYQPSLPSSPSYSPFPRPSANPDDQADRAGDTLSGKTGRRTKEGAPGCCVAIYSVFVLRLPSAPRTNPTSRASRRAALGDCRSAAASMFSLRCLLPILFSANLSFILERTREIRETESR